VPVEEGVGRLEVPGALSKESIWQAETGEQGAAAGALDEQ